MATLFVRHNVADFGVWKQAYDDFDSMEAAKAFAASTELREAMVDAGVQGETTMWFAKKV